MPAISPMTFGGDDERSDTPARNVIESIGFWAHSLRDAVCKFVSFRLMAEQAPDLLQAETPKRRQRLVEVRAAYSVLEWDFASLIEQWRRERS